MTNLHRAHGLLAITLGLVLFASLAQTTNAQVEKAAPAASSPATHRFDLGVNFTYKFAQIADPQTTTFMLPGISLDGAYSLSKKHDGLAVVGELSAETVNNITPKVNLQQVTVSAGPRYTVHFHKTGNHAIEIYAQALAGYVYANNSVFPGPTSPSFNASSSSYETGGGMNIHLSKSVALRLFEADFITTALPNNANNRQYDLRLSNGIVFHFN